ncbi:MAG: SDR family oxidoreductase [Terracidiphilus sp.]|jgi:NAD(P)-dependent dehydrogenase (short-subunit alcohol dehydrogenase family)
MGEDAVIPYGFSGKVALITGAGGGLGTATAMRLAASGAQIIAVDRDEEPTRELVKALPGGHYALIRDLRPALAAKKVVEEALTLTGRLDIVINSAGVCHFNRINEISPEEWDEVLEVDLRSMHFLSVAAAEAMDGSTGGSIINIGSNAGRKGRAMGAHYAAAKAAVASLTESLALAYGAKQITVNTVCPAVVLTGMWERNFIELERITGKAPEQLTQAWIDATPLKRLGTVEDVANLIAFLASDEASFITAQTINVCGGFMLTC